MESLNLQLRIEFLSLLVGAKAGSSSITRRMSQIESELSTVMELNSISKFLLDCE